MLIKVPEGQDIEFAGEGAQRPSKAPTYAALALVSSRCPRHSCIAAPRGPRALAVLAVLAALLVLFTPLQC